MAPEPNDFLPNECAYSEKRRFLTREDARHANDRYRETYGAEYQTLYPYACPTGGHWHLSKFRQAFRICPHCGDRRPSWYDNRRGQWVVYAHGNCATGAVHT